MPNLITLSRRTSGALGALAIAVIGLTAPASAASVSIGVLTCKVYGGAGFIFGSTKDIDCKFEGINGIKEGYHGAINKYGLDIGFTGSSFMVWTVFAPSTNVPSGALAGDYAGVSAEATVGLGVGANALLGGFKDSIALQPVSGQVQEGLIIAVAISALCRTLIFGRRGPSGWQRRQPHSPIQQSASAPDRARPCVGTRT